MPPVGACPVGSWLTSVPPEPAMPMPFRRGARPVLDPIVEFLHIEAVGGAVLLAATIAALALANSPLVDGYQRLWDQEPAPTAVRRRARKDGAAPFHLGDSCRCVGGRLRCARVQPASGPAMRPMCSSCRTWPGTCCRRPRSSIWPASALPARAGPAGHHHRPAGTTPPRPAPGLAGQPRAGPLRPPATAHQRQGIRPEVAPVRWTGRG
jgi:hypothetical protein